MNRKAARTKFYTITKVSRKYIMLKRNEEISLGSKAQYKRGNSARRHCVLEEIEQHVSLNT